MISGKNKTRAFIISLVLTFISWMLIISNLILRVTTLMQFGVNSIDAVGFTLVTILLSVYTLLILFKFSNSAYFPLLLLLLHMATMRGSSLAIAFVIADLAILILLNTGPSIQTNHTNNQRNYYYSSFTGFDNTGYQSKPNSSNKSGKSLDSQDIIDAEYVTKE